MTTKNAIWILIPVYNEGKIIKKVLDSLHENGYFNIILIDDGSSDNTFQEASNSDVIALRHSLNRGKGAALKTGIEAALRLKAKIIVTFDGDGQHDPKDIVKMTEHIYRGYDVVLGSRYLSKQTIPLIRRIGNLLANIWTFLLFGIWVTDSQSGLRAYTSEALKVLDIQSERYEVESEILRDIIRYNLFYIEVPMRVRYTRYSLNKSTKQNIYSGILTMGKLLLKGN